MKPKNQLILFTLLSLIFFSEPLWAQAGKSDTISIKTSVVCGMCKERVEQNLAFEKGIRDVNVNLETKMVLVRFDPRKTNPAEIRKKISKLGYDADEVEADSVAYEKLPACCKKGVPAH